jgi:hypothetical protein
MNRERNLRKTDVEKSRSAGGSELKNGITLMRTPISINFESRCKQHMGKNVCV